MTTPLAEISPTPLAEILLRHGRRILTAFGGG